MESDRDELLQARAEELHRKHPVILIHDHEPPLDDGNDCRSAGISGKVLLPVLDVFVDRDPKASIPVFEGWADHARAVFTAVNQSVRSTGGRVLPATTAGDFRRAHEEGKIAVLLGSEGGKLIEGSLDTLPDLYEMGYRCMQLTWNCPNQINRIRDDKESGLTDFGRRLIPVLNRMGIMIDAMHAGRGTFLELAELSAQPLLLSHGGAHGALRRSRHPESNRSDFRSFVDDEMLRILARTGGLLGISFYGPLFHWDKGGSDMLLADVADHFQYVAETVGADVLALGGDYFPTDGAWAQFGPKGGVSRDHFVPPKARLSRLTAHLLSRGWRVDDIVKVLGGNFLRFCDRVLKRE